MKPEPINAQIADLNRQITELMAERRRLEVSLANALKKQRAKE